MLNGPAKDSSSAVLSNLQLELLQFLHFRQLHISNQSTECTETPQTDFK